MVNHHPAPELLAAFSAGSLHLSHALCVSTHVERCEECKSNLLRLNSMGAALLEQQPTQPVPAQLKQDVMATLEQLPADTPLQASRTHSRIPSALRQFIPGNYDDLPWQVLSPSIRAATLCTDLNGARVEMLRIKAGAQVATHTHTGDEYTLVLEGSFSDETGIFREGDFVVRDSSHQHRPVATKDRECICLTVTDAPLRFTGFFGRLLNPFVRKRYLPV